MSFDDNAELPWPRAGDKVFTEAPDRWMNACVNWGGGLIYAIGYRAAGDALVERIATTHADQDTLVYPIVFCYRQYLELMLKDVFAEARAYHHMTDPVPDKHPVHKHQLVPLWREVRPLLERRWRESRGEHDAVGEALRQFDAVDRLSFAFRYPTTKTGEQSLPKEMLRINLRNLSEVVVRVGTFLEATIDALDAARQAGDDYLADLEYEADLSDGY